MNGFFDLKGFDQMKDDDRIYCENSEFAPDSNATNKDAETGTKGTTVSIPGGDKETPTAKPVEGATVSIPGGDNEKPSAKPVEGTSVSIPSKVVLDDTTYNAAMSQLKQTFKEAIDILGMMENAQIVHETLEDRQKAYMENAFAEAMLDACENGPVFEAVSKDDKDEVKEIVQKLREKIRKDLKSDGIKFYKPNVLLRAISALFISWHITPVIQQLWSMRLWQVLGVCLVEAGNTIDLQKQLTERYADTLGDYKILTVLTIPTIVDLFRLKLGWKNVKSCYFMIVDKKIPSEFNEFQKKLGDAIEDAQKDAQKEAEKENKDGKDDEKDD